MEVLLRAKAGARDGTAQLVLVLDAAADRGLGRRLLRLAERLAPAPVAALDFVAGALDPAALDAAAVPEDQAVSVDSLTALLLHHGALAVRDWLRALRAGRAGPVLALLQTDAHGQRAVDLLLDEASAIIRPVDDGQRLYVLRRGAFGRVHETREQLLDGDGDGGALELRPLRPAGEPQPEAAPAAADADQPPPDMQLPYEHRGAPVWLDAHDLEFEDDDPDDDLDI